MNLSQIQPMQAYKSSRSQMDNKVKGSRFMELMDKELNKQIGYLIKKHRQKKNITLEKLAEMANLDGNNIGRFERGEKCPHLKTFFKLIIVLDIQASEYIPIFKTLLLQTRE